MKILKWNKIEGSAEHRTRVWRASLKKNKDAYFIIYEHSFIYSLWFVEKVYYNDKPDFVHKRIGEYKKLNEAKDLVQSLVDCIFDCFILERKS